MNLDVLAPGKLVDIFAMAVDPIADIGPATKVDFATKDRAAFRAPTRGDHRTSFRT